MSKIVSLTSALLGSLLIVSTAGAVAPQPIGPGDARFVFERAGDGFARMDKATGEVSYCRMEAPGLVCRLAADDRRAYENQINDLARENSDLKARMAYAAGGRIEQPLTQKKLDAGDQIDLMEYIVKRMLHAARDIKDEVKKSDLDPPRDWR